MRAGRDAVRRLNGIVFDGPLQLLTETDHAGQLVRSAGGSPFLPLVLRAAHGSKSDGAIFRTAPGTRPMVAAKVTNRSAKGGGLTVSLAVRRAALPRTAEACGAGGAARLRTRLVLDDQSHAPVTVTAEQPWRCGKSTLTTP